MSKNIDGIINIRDFPCYQQFETFLSLEYDPEEYNSLSQEEIMDQFELIFMMGLRQAKDIKQKQKSYKLLKQKNFIKQARNLHYILWQTIIPGRGIGSCSTILIVCQSPTRCPRTLGRN